MSLELEMKRAKDEHEEDMKMEAMRIKCEWCTDVAIFRILCRDNQYERYACKQHQTKIRRQANLDGYYPSDLEEGYSLSGPYQFDDMIYRGEKP